MTVLMVRYQVREEDVADVEAAIRLAIAAVERERPAGVRYAMGKLADGVTFVGLLEFPDGTGNPLLAIPEARDLQQKLPSWVVGEPPAPQPLHVVGSYELFR